MRLSKCARPISHRGWDHAVKNQAPEWKVLNFEVVADPIAMMAGLWQTSSAGGGVEEVDFPPEV